MTAVENDTSVVELGPDGEGVNVEQVVGVAKKTSSLTISQQARSAMEQSQRSLAGMVERRRLIYGITTGFGPLAGRFIDPAQAAQLQRNLVYHLASGVGRPFSTLQTRAIMVARAVNLSKGHSGVQAATLQLIIDCLDRDLLPIVPSMGTVGASGDLTPLAHMTLMLFGEGDASFKGERMAAADAFRRAHLTPLLPGNREALALVNGTSAMTAVSALNHHDARRALRLALRNTVLYSELLYGRIEAWDPRLADLRPHPGQQWATAELNRLCEGSALLKPKTPVFLDAGLFADSPVASANPLPQDPYTIRCAPQILGAIADVLQFHGNIVETELNSVTDNPVFVDDDALHGGNFYGQHIAFASDALMTAVIKLAVHSERKIARITDETQNAGLPAFLQGSQTGLQSGFMGAQVTASAIVAEMRTKAIPASIQSIPTNANNQDVVTMGTIGARRTAELIDYLYDLLAIESLMLVQGMDIRERSGVTGFSISSREVRSLVRGVSPFLDDDRPLHSEISHLAQNLRTAALLN